MERPRWLNRVRLRLRSLLRRRAADADLDDELQFHLEHAIEEYRARGLSPAGARRAALIRLGGLDRRREECRETRGLSMAWNLARDVRLAARLLRRRPMLAGASILTLALAIGANISIAGLVDRVLLHPLDVPDARGLVTIQQMASSSTGAATTSMNWETASAAGRMATLAPVAISSARSDRTTTRLAVSFASGDLVDIAAGQFVSVNYFQTLRLTPARGRDFTASDDAVDAPVATILGDRFWRARFGGDRDVVGRTIRINDMPATIVGVAPRTFAGTELDVSPPDLFLPLMTASRVATDIGRQTDGRGMFFNGPGGARSPVSPVSDFKVVARPRAGGVTQATAELSARLGPSWGVVPLVETMVPFGSRADLRRFLTLLGGAVALTLLIGCANLAGLLLARSEERRAEFAVCRALGAGRGRLVQGLIVEAAILALCGGGLAVGVAQWIDRRLTDFVLPGGIALSSFRSGIDLRTMAVAGVSTVLVAGLIGVAPAARLARRRFPFDLKMQRASADRLGLMRALAAVQVTVSVVLVFGAALFVRATSNALATDLGFSSAGLVSASVSVPPAKGPNGMAAIQALVERVRTLPGVTAATVGPLPLVNRSDVEIRDSLDVDGAPVDLSTSAELVYAGADYFTTLGVPVIAGRDFGPNDRMGTRPIAIINEAAKRQFFGEADPLEHRVAIPLRWRTRADEYTVVGLVRNVSTRDVRAGDRPIIYLPRSQHEAYLAGYLVGSGRGLLIVRTQQSARGFAPTLARAAQDLGLSVTETTTVEQRVGEILMPQRLGRAFLMLLGAMASLLTVVGLYGLVSCIVQRHTKEIGIRMALGAGAAEIAGTVLRRMLLPIFAGIAAGSTLAWLAGGYADRFMYGMKGTDLQTLAFVAAVLIAASLVAVLAPTRRALRIDPVETLRVD